MSVNEGRLSINSLIISSDDKNTRVKDGKKPHASFRINPIKNKETIKLASFIRDNTNTPQESNLSINSKDFTLESTVYNKSNNPPSNLLPVKKKIIHYENKNDGKDILTLSPGLCLIKGNDSDNIRDLSPGTEIDIPNTIGGSGKEDLKLDHLSHTNGITLQSNKIDQISEFKIETTSGKFDINHFIIGSNSKAIAIITEIITNSDNEDSSASFIKVRSLSGKFRQKTAPGADTFGEEIKSIYNGIESKGKFISGNIFTIEPEKDPISKSIEIGNIIVNKKTSAQVTAKAKIKKILNCKQFEVTITKGSFAKDEEVYVAGNKCGKFLSSNEYYNQVIENSGNIMAKCGTFTITGDLQVLGKTTSISTETTIVEDINIQLGVSTKPLSTATMDKTTGEIILNTGDASINDIKVNDYVGLLGSSVPVGTIKNIKIARSGYGYKLLPEITVGSPSPQLNKDYIPRTWSSQSQYDSGESIAEALITEFYSENDTGIRVNGNSYHKLTITASAQHDITVSGKKIPDALGSSIGQTVHIYFENDIEKYTAIIKDNYTLTITGPVSSPNKILTVSDGTKILLDNYSDAPSYPNSMYRIEISKTGDKYSSSPIVNMINHPDNIPIRKATFQSKIKDGKLTYIKTIDSGEGYKKLNKHDGLKSNSTITDQNIGTNGIDLDVKGVTAPVGLKSNKNSKIIFSIEDDTHEYTAIIKSDTKLTIKSSRNSNGDPDTKITIANDKKIYHFYPKLEIITDSLAKAYVELDANNKIQQGKIHIIDSGYGYIEKPDIYINNNKETNFEITMDTLNNGSIIEIKNNNTDKKYTTPKTFDGLYTDSTINNVNIGGGQELLVDGVNASFGLKAKIDSEIIFSIENDTHQYTATIESDTKLKITSSRNSNGDPDTQITIAKNKKIYHYNPKIDILPKNSIKCLAKSKIDNGAVSSIDIIKPGRGYLNDPLIYITDPPRSSNAQAYVSRIISGVIKEIIVTDRGQGYNIIPSIKIIDKLGKGTGAQVKVDNIVSTESNSINPILQIDSGGTGYTDPSMIDVIFTENTVSMGAEAVATIYNNSLEKKQFKVTKVVGNNIYIKKGTDDIDNYVFSELNTTLNTIDGKQLKPLITKHKSKDQVNNAGLDIEYVDPINDQLTTKSIRYKSIGTVNTWDFNAPIRMDPINEVDKSSQNKQLSPITIGKRPDKSILKPNRGWSIVAEGNDFIIRNEDIGSDGQIVFKGSSMPINTIS